MNSSNTIQQTPIFYCHQHNKEIAEAICVQEGCNGQLLCRNCIFEIHPDHPEQFVMIDEILSSDPSQQTQLTLQKKQFADQLGKSRELTAQLFQQTSMNVDNLDNFKGKVPINANSSLHSILNQLSALGTKKGESTVFMDNEPLSESLIQFSDHLEAESLGSKKSVEKYSRIQNKLNQVYGELSKKFEELTRELNLARPPKILNVTVWANDTNTNEENILPMPEKLITTQKGRSEHEFDSLPPSENKENLIIHQIPRKESKNQQIQNHMGLAIDLERPDSPAGDTVISSANSFKDFAIAGTMSSPPPFSSIKRQQNLQYTGATVLSSLPSEIKDRNNQTPREPLKGVNLFGNDKHDHVKTILEEITEFFDDEENKRKETILVFEAWFDYAEKNVGKMSKEHIGLLNRQKAYINAYKKTIKKPGDLNSVDLAIEEFLENAQVNRAEQNFSILECALDDLETKLIDAYRNAVDETYFRCTLDYMAKSRVLFDVGVEKLNDHLRKFRLVWIEKQSRLNRMKSEKIPMSEYEKIIYELWSFGIKFPEMEGLLLDYFEFKRAQAKVKYFLLRFNQLGRARAKIFVDRAVIGEDEESFLIDQLEEVSLEKAISTKKECLTLCKGVELKDEFDQFARLIEEAEQLKKKITQVIGSFHPSSNSNQELLNACSSALFFPDMLKLKQLNSLFGLRENIGTPSKSNVPIQKDETPISWVVSMANLIADVFFDNGNHQKSNEIKQALGLIESNSSSLSSVCLLCMSCTSELLKQGEQKYKEPLQELVSKSLNLKCSIPAEVRELINYITTVSWGIKTNAILQSGDPSIEQLKECSRKFLQGQTEWYEDPKIEEIHFNLVLALKLFTELQELESIDWCKVIEEKNCGSIIEKCHALEKKYQVLNIPIPRIWHQIQNILALCKTGVKFTQPDAKYRLEELEKFFEKIKTSHNAPTTANVQVSNLEQLINSIKDLLVQSEQLQELNLSELGQMMSDFLQNNVTKANFLEKINGVSAYLENIKQKIDSLKSSCVELGENYFERIIAQIEGLNEEIQNIKQGSLKKVIFIVELADTTPIVTCTLWILAASAMLNLRKYPLKTYEKTLGLVKPSWNIGFSVQESKLHQTLAQEYEKGLSIKRELLFAMRALNDTNELTDTDLLLVKFSPVSSEYLRGLLRRMKRSKICFANASKHIKIVLQKAKESEKEFNEMNQGATIQSKISEEEFCEFLRKVKKSGSCSRELSHKLHDLAAHSKKLRVLCNNLENIPKDSPQWLLEMNAVTSLYDNFPIFSKSCDKVLNAFREKYSTTKSSLHSKSNSENIEPNSLKKIKDNNGDQITQPQKHSLSKAIYVSPLQEKLEEKIRSELGDGKLLTLKAHLSSLTEVLEDFQKESTTENMQEDFWMARLLVLIKNRRHSQFWNLLESGNFDKYAMSLLKKVMKMNDTELVEFENQLKTRIEKSKTSNTTAKTLIMNMLYSGKAAIKSSFSD